MTPRETAYVLTAQGYAITSRHYRHASRIDRPNWYEWCELKGIVPCEDHYRRCLSKDTITVSEEVRRLMCPSAGVQFGQYRARWDSVAV